MPARLAGAAGRAAIRRLPTLRCGAVVTRGRLTAACRATALEAGQWQRHDGTFVALRKMPDPHLVNALLRALADREPVTITRPLAAEVARRNLRDYALAVAAERAREEAGR